MGVYFFRSTETTRRWKECSPSQCLETPTIYSTFSYIESIISARGFSTKYVNGITSFCGAAASLGVTLVSDEESLHIEPSLENFEKENATYIYMKSARLIDGIKDKDEKLSKTPYLVERCGMEEEKKYIGVENFPDKTEYLSLVIRK